MDSIANGYGCRPCKIKQVQLDVTDAILHFIGDGSALSHLNASNVDFGTLSTSVFPASGVTAGTYGSSSNVSQVTIDQYGRVTSAANVAVVSSQWTGLPGSSIYYIPGVSVGSSASATANLQVTGNVYVSNSVTTTNVYATNYYGDGGLLSNVASQWSGTKGSPIYYIPGVSVGSSASATANLQVTGNVYVSNAVTVPNVHVTDTLDVLGSMTANAANATFFFDTFTIPYINTQYLNVSANTTLTGNLVVATANIATLNVGYLTVNSAVVYGATTLNVYGVSNLSTVTADTLSMSGDVFIGNVAITGAVQTTTGPMSRLTFDNTANTSIYPNKIVLYANTASSQYCGFGVTNLGPTGGASIAYGARQNHIFNTGSTLNTEIMRIGVLGTVGIGTASATAKLHVGTSLTQNVQVLVEASNVAIATTGGGRVGFGTSVPTANLHVIGNVYASNAVTTTNVFANTSTLTGTTGQTTLNVTGNLYVSNALTTTNVFANTSTLTGTTGQTTLNVTGNLYVSNALTTTNVFANTSTLTGTTGQTTLNVTGNLYVSNAVTTTNIVTAGFTSNAFNTVFNYSTLTIPFVQCTTLNTASTANVLTLSVTGSVGQTSLNVTGNLYASNAVTTTNVFATNGLGVGPGTLGSNVVIFSNVSGGSNVFVMDSNGRIGVGIENPQTPLHIQVGSVSITPSGSINTGVIIGAGISGQTAQALNMGTMGGASNYAWIQSNYVNNAGVPNYLAINQKGGYVGIGGPTNPTSNLQVTGNVYVSNAVTTTNVFANTTTLTGTTGQTTLNVTGNVYASNAVTTTNVFANTSTLTGTTGQTSLTVTGNVYASNAVTTTNVFANTSTLIGTTGQTTLNVTGNVYASNAVTTTNLYTAGFTSNATNTIFNFDTLTIPFINSTTLNVASTSNLDTVTLTGEPGLTTVFASGNVYASNALTTTNVFAATETLTGTTGRTTSTITGNLYVSNALTTTNVFATTVSAANPIPFRNRIINGGMTVWQRNTASISTTTGIYTTADRWCGALGTSGLILSQWPGPTEAPQFPYSLQVTTSTTTSGTPLIEQHIENLNIPDLLNGTPVTVSFYAGQPYGTLMPLTVGLYYGTVVNNFGTQTLAVAATQNTPTLTTANVYYSLSFTLTSSLGATNGLSLRFTTGGASAVGSTILLTGVQLEKGAIATPFEMRPYATELALCQRYYYQLTSPTAAVQGSAAVYAIFGTAIGITTTAFWLQIPFPVPMRNPYYTFSNSAVTNFQLLPTGTTTITSVATQSDSYTPVSATLNFVGTNIVAGSSYIFRTNNLTGSTTAFFGFSCEL